jgi:hypothetical protein
MRMATQETVREGVREGAWVRPENRWQGGANSIHNDETARKVGMRGGAIPGTVHLGHFQPILDEMFADRWLKDGVVSLYYTYATLDKEQVRAVVRAPAGPAPDGLYEAWVETPDGKTVAKGHVACGKTAGPAYVRGLPLEGGGERRIVAAMSVGQDAPRVEAFLVEDGEGGVVRNPTAMFQAMRTDFPPKSIAQPSVGLFGATEITLRAGPIRAGIAYRKTGKIVCLGASPKTEFAWVDSFLHDRDGVLIAEMRHLTRWMKASSPLWS